MHSKRGLEFCTFDPMIPRRKFEITIGRRKMGLGERTIVMGVLNVTPDSFSDGGRYFSFQKAVQHGVELARTGADWIDVGGESTRPGSEAVQLEEELRRVVPVIQALHRKLPSVPISIDTTKARVAEEAVRAGATIVNDVSGLRYDPSLAKVARRHRTALILMHLRGRPETMQQKPFARSIWRSVWGGLAWSIQTALDCGVYHSQLIIDPGLGFGKTRRQNYEILAEIDRLYSFGLPVMVGTSRKSFVQAVVAGEGLGDSKGSIGAKGESKSSPAHDWKLITKKTNKGLAWDREALRLMNLGDAAAVVASILAGAHIVRVHDVESVIPAVRIADAVLSAGELA
ncbi:MAG TPA: dihydropteroate synthase [Terriglobia bacterium]|nr:dihydropteroate synthase [Terriglobia bacterium]